MNTPARAQTRLEEAANAVVHALAFIAALGAVVIYFPEARHDPFAASRIGFAVYGATLLIVYLSSVLYHGLPDGRGKLLFMRIDHCAIFLFIAGTYSAFALSERAAPGRWTDLAIIWSLALGGSALHALGKMTHVLWSIVAYMTFGWFAMLIAVPLLERMPPSGLQWVLGGGITYTAGVLFYMRAHRIRFAHCVWHFFVVAGSTCHFCAVVLCT
jgi:hemolysin III